jgi:DNA-binding Lrp family transcriptional regulator
MRAYVLLSIRVGEVTQVLRLLKRVDGVTEANMTFGPYDAVVVIDAKDVNDVGKILSNFIQPIPGILETLTCLAVELE